MMARSWTSTPTHLWMSSLTRDTLYRGEILVQTSKYIALRLFLAHADSGTV